jgi:PAS domain S-box-containing protein
LEAAQIRVLHVDDEPDLADLAATFVEREDDRFVVETVTSASEGLERLADAEFDCIVSDYEMPGQNGIEFLESIRAEYPDLPFILYTGKGSEEVASEAISAGVTDYLQKETGTSQYTVLRNRITNAVEQYRSKREIEANRKRLSLFFDQSPLGVIEWDEEFNVASVNQRAEEILGYTAADLVGGSWERIVPESDRESVAAVVSNLLDAEDGYHSINENIREDGERIVCEWHNRVVTDDSGDAVAVFSQFRDITARKEREEELELKNRAMNEAPVGITISGPSRDDNPLIYANEQFEQLTGYSKADVLGRNCRFLQGEQTADEPVAEMRTAIEATDSVTVELRNYRKDGTEFWNRVSIAPVRTPEGDITNWVGFQQDVTAEKEREQQLQQQERRYQAVFDDPNTLFGLIDTDGTVLDINQTAMEYVAASHDEVIGTPFWATSWFDHSAEVQQDVREWIDRAAGGEYVEFEADLVRPDGDPYTVEGVFRPVTNDDGAVVSLVISGRDITERKQRERELEQYEAYLEGSNDIITVLNDDGTVQYQSPSVTRVLGYEQDELLGTNGFSLVHPDDRDELFETFSSLVAEPSETVTVEARFRAADGEWRWLEVRGTNYLDHPMIDGVVTNNRDITDRKQRENRLEALNQTARELIAADTREEVAAGGVEAASEILGLDASAIHLYDQERGGLAPIAQSERSVEIVGDAPVLERNDSIAWRVYENGEPLAVDDVHDDPDIYNPDSPVRSELILPIGDDGILIAGSESLAAFEGEDLVLGEILARTIATALAQVTRTEQLRSREQELLRQNDRLEEFASVVSHDLQNPLQVAEGRLELVREDCENEQLDAIERALDRMDALIEDLLTLAREGEQVQEQEPVDIAETVRSCWQHIETPTATLHVETDTTIRADRSRLQQLLENLVRNAIDHGGDDVTITIGDVDTGFYVADDGPGIPPDERGSVFEAGYSTSQEGTGFGLSIVQEISSAHGWGITITDSIDGGARFEITGCEVI